MFIITSSLFRNIIIHYFFDDIGAWHALDRWKASSIIIVCWKVLESPGKPVESWKADGMPEWKASGKDRIARG